MEKTWLTTVSACSQRSTLMALLLEFSVKMICLLTRPNLKCYLHGNYSARSISVIIIGCPSGYF